MRAPIMHWLDTLGCMAKSEYSLPWGVCDLVGVQFQDAHAVQRLASGQTQSIDALELLELLDLVPSQGTRRAITLARVKRLLASARSPEQVDADIGRLMARRLLWFPRKNQVQRTARWDPLQGKIIAVEMKLSRISVALTQAQAHLAFAHEAYVALPYDVAKRALENRRRQEFVSRRVGLLAIRPNSVHVKITSHGRPSVARRHKSLQTQCSERLWKAWLTSNASSTASRRSPVDVNSRPRVGGRAASRERKLRRVADIMLRADQQ